METETSLLLSLRCDRGEFSKFVASSFKWKARWRNFAFGLLLSPIVNIFNIKGTKIIEDSSPRFSDLRSACSTLRVLLFDQCHLEGKLCAPRQSEQK